MTSETMTGETKTLATHVLPEANRHLVLERLEGLRRRIEKKGLNGVMEFTCSPTFWVYQDKRYETRDAAYEAYKPVRDRSNAKPPRAYFTLEFLSLETPVLSGWRFVARVTHLVDKETGEPANVMLTAPGEEVPKSFHSASTHCDHCNCSRLRKYTFICRKGRKYVQVGSNCLRDFLGHDPERMLNWYDTLDSMKDELSDVARIRPIDTLPLEFLLKMAAYALQLRPFKSSREENSTSSHVLGLIALLNNNHISVRKDREQLRQALKDQADELDATVEAAKSWAASLAGRNTFEQNQLTLLRAGEVPYPFVSQAVYWVEAVRRTAAEAVVEQSRQEQKKAEAAAAAKSDFYGVVGQRVTLDLTVIRSRELEGYQGRPATMLVFRDDESRQFVWFASQRILLDQPKQRVVGTIKSHQVYNGVKQTYLTRCKLVGV